MVNQIIQKYNSGMKIKDVANELKISPGKVSKVLKTNGVKIRHRNDYGNPAKAPDFAQRVLSKRRSYKGKNNPNYGKPCPQKVIEATKKANTGRISPRKGKPYPQSIGWVCKEPDRPDKLYFIKLHNGKYKVGRSYRGWLYRKKETLELLGEWSAKSTDIWNLEKKILERFREHKAPLTEMSMGRGMTEHFKETLPVLEVITFIEDFLYHVPTASNQSLDCPQSLPY